MKTAVTVNDLLRNLEGPGIRGRTIGFVPTMGALHEGHLSLVHQSVKDCEFTVVSIFVNPAQFGPGEDLALYPRNVEKDLKILKEQTGASLVFLPSAEEMYPEGSSTLVDVADLSGKLEGRARPGHFKGVCTIVAKLFNLVQPCKAFFGWKDAQQLIIIKKMVKDLNMKIEIIGMPTVREKDNLAASSRNVYLSPGERKKALCLSAALLKIREMVECKGIKDAETLIAEGKKIISESGVELDYLEAVSFSDLEPVKYISSNTGVLGAIKTGRIRLIDNVIWE